MLNGTGRWIIPCTALSLDKFKGSPTTRHHGRKQVWGRLGLSSPHSFFSYCRATLTTSSVLAITTYTCTPSSCSNSLSGYKTQTSASSIKSKRAFTLFGASVCPSSSYFVFLSHVWSNQLKFLFISGIYLHTQVKDKFLPLLVEVEQLSIFCSVLLYSVHESLWGWDQVARMNTVTSKDKPEHFQCSSDTSTTHQVFNITNIQRYSEGQVIIVRWNTSL